MHKSILLYLSFFLCSLLSCTDENEFKQNNILPDAPNGFVNIEFDLKSGAFHKPATKTIRTDSDFDTPWVLSFKLQNQGSPRPDTLFVEAVKTQISDNKYYMQLSASQDPHLLYFVANADKVIEKKKTLFTSKTYGEVMSLLTFGNPSPEADFGLTPLSNPQGSVPFANQNIPMTATAQLNKIVKGIKLSKTVNLQRIVSKIYVDATKANQKNGFVLTGLTVIDVPSIGYMNNKINFESVQPQSIIDYGRKSGSDRLTTLVLENIDNNTTHSPETDRPIYVYPFLEKDPRGGVYQVIFSGHFGDNITKYFKIKLGGPNNPVALSKPNTSFLIDVESIASSGYVSLEHALQFEASTGVVTKVTLIDQAHEIIANEKYYLGLSNSEYHLFDSGVSDIETVATITTNAFTSGSTCPNSTIQLKHSTAGIELLTQNISSNSTDINVKFQQDTCEGIIEVKIGELTKQIHIYKGLTSRVPLPISKNIVNAEVIYGSGISISDSRSNSNKNSIYNPNGTNLYIFQKGSIYKEEAEIRCLKKDGSNMLIKMKYNKGFAGSNIYWDGSKLTFEDISHSDTVSTKSLYQGVFFCWGSLIAYGNQAPRSFKFLFSPSGKIYSDVSFDDNRVLDLPQLAKKGIQNKTEQYLLQHHAPNKDIGDICKYITDKGWGPPGRWRVPTRVDFYNIGYHYNRGRWDEFLYNINGTGVCISHEQYGSVVFSHGGGMHKGLSGFSGGYSPPNTASLQIHASFPISYFTGATYTVSDNTFFNPVRCVKY